MRVFESLLVASLLTISTSANACRQDSFEPEDYLRADLIVVGTIKNYRIVPNSVREEALRKSIANGSITQWERDQYNADLAAGKPPGGVYGLFDVEVEEVVRGKVAKTFSAVFFDSTMSGQGDDSPSILPRQMGPKKMLVALRSPTKLFDPPRYRVIVNDCIGAMMFDARPDTARNMRRQLRWVQDYLNKHQTK